ncbi:hypothetical protein BG015_007607 [Linnemannia schmuckeri]|uniref:Protein kinase domain-containing protein n=1 Tax=Linnemannia schmuckeri TaxID=64567 RepID=A0A9P5RY93_9FUNG|nr:hypothetical protein BG015_007607 [Linnemannia schmuckeri]
MPSEPLISSFGHRHSTVASPFRPGSIFYNDPTASSIDSNNNDNINNMPSSDSLLFPSSKESSSSSTTNDNNTDCPPSLLNSNSTPSANKKHRAFLSTNDPAAVSLASPPPSPSRNSIFDQPWSSLSGPNISSLRASTTLPGHGTIEAVSSIPTTAATTPAHSPLAARSLKHHYAAAVTAAPSAPSAPSTYSSKIHLHNKHSLASDASTNATAATTTTGAGTGAGAGVGVRDAVAVTLSPVDSNGFKSSQTLSSSSYREQQQALTSAAATRSIPLLSNDSLYNSNNNNYNNNKNSSASDSKTMSADGIECQSAFSLDLDRSKVNLLGQGLNAEVYKAWLHPSSAPMKEYLSSRKTMRSLTCNDIFQGDKKTTTTSVEHQEGKSGAEAVLCAAKCLFTDADSQSVGLAEAETLRRLHAEQANHPGRKYLVDFYGLYDQTTQQGLSTGDVAHVDRIPRSKDQEAQWVLLLENCQNGTVWDWIRRHPERVDYQQWLTWALQLFSTKDKGTKDSMHFGLEGGLGRGTPPYSAPEMFASVAGGAHYGQSIDIYSLGVSLYVIGLTAQEPFHKLKSVMEMMVWIKKGGFWLWEDQRWVHDRGQVPKITSSSRVTISSAAQMQAAQAASHPQGRHLDRQSSSSALRSPSTSLVPPLHLPRINTQLSRDTDMLDPSSASSMNSPSGYLYPASPWSQLSGHFLPGYSPDRSLKSSQPSTPVSPSPLPSPLIRTHTPRSRSSSASLRKEEPRRKSGEAVMRFLNGDVVQQEVIALLKDMCQSDPEQRPDTKQVLERLREMKAQFDADTEAAEAEAAAAAAAAEDEECQDMDVDTSM